MPKYARVFLFALLALAGCGNTTIIFATISPSTQSLDSGQSVTLTATVSNDSSNAGVKWSLNGVGTLTSQTSTSVVYTAPASVSTASTISVLATPVNNSLFVAATQILLTPAPVITTTTLSSGLVGVAYSAQLNASGGATPLTWTLTSGTLPAGLSLSSTGVISGTPTAVGNATFTVKATDSASTPLSSSQTLTLSISAPALTITTPSVPNGVVGKAYSTQLALVGGIAPYTWSIASGTLPTGITLSSTGLLSGSPTAPGSFTFTAQVKDTEPTPQTALKSYTFTIYNALTITTTSLAAGSLHNAYSAKLQYTGGTPAVTWSLASGSLPTGLTLSQAGVISGTPTATGTSSFTVQLIDSSSPQQTATASLSINILLSTLAITTTSLPQGTIGTTYTSTTLQYSGGNPPVTWALASGSAALPPGLSLSSAGVISGKPTTAGTYPITVQATDTTPASVTQTLSITIVALAPLTISTTSIPSGNIGTAYSTTLAATGGAVPYTWSIASGTLPQGLSLSTVGVLSGTPLSAGSYTFTVQVSDSESTPATTSRQLTLTIGTTLAISPNNSQLSGSYAFLINGFNVGGGSGSVYGYAALGSLSMNGAGALTGVEYTNSPSGLQSAVAVTGSYTLGSDGRGFMVLTTASATNVYVIAASNRSGGIAQSFAVSEFDNSTAATGSMNAAGVAKLQTAAAFAASTVNGTFAFGLSGESPCSTCIAPAPLFGPIAAVGLFTANGVSTISSGQEDGAAYGSNYTGVTLTGSFTAPSSSTGVGTMHFVETGSLFNTPPANYVYVIVSTNEMLLMSSDSHASNALLSGDAQLQKQTTYSAASLSGSLIGYESQASGGNGSTVYPTALNAILTDLTITGSGTATLAQDANRAGTFSSTAGSPTAVTYTTAANGRTAVTTSGASNQVLYLYNTDTGFALDQAATTAYPALLQYRQQVATAPYPVLLSGPFAAGTVPTAIPATDVSGIYNFQRNTGGVDSGISGDLTTTLDSSSTAGILGYSQSSSYLYTESSTGRHVITLSGSTTPQVIVYGITSSLGVAIPATSGATPVVTLLQVY